MERSRGKNKIHHAWFILASCCAFFGAAMGICSNCAGIFTAPICREMGWSLSKYNSTGIFNGCTAILTLLSVDTVYRKANTKLVLFVASFLYAGCYILRGCCSSYLGFVLVNILMGASSAFLFYVPVPMLLNNWFEKKRGMAMGIAMLSSGITGAVFNPLLNRVIIAAGWRFASYINGMVAMAVGLPFIILFIAKKPRDLGMEPYGAGEGGEGEEAGKDKVTYADARDCQRSMPLNQKRAHFRYCFALAIMLLLISVVPGNLPYYAVENGMSSTVGAALLSTALFGNMVSKFLLGLSADRFGPKITWMTSLTLVIPALIILLNSSAPVVLLFVAAFLSGVTAANNTMVVPSLISTFSSGDEYMSFISKCSVGTMISSTFSGFLVSLVHDYGNTYRPVFIFFVILETACLAILLFVLPRRKNNEFI